MDIQEIAKTGCLIIVVACCAFFYIGIMLTIMLEIVKKIKGV